MTQKFTDNDAGRWHSCPVGCGAEYRSESAARYCCNQSMQKAEKARRRASRELEL